MSSWSITYETTTYPRNTGLWACHATIRALIISINTSAPVTCIIAIPAGRTVTNAISGRTT